MFKYMVITSCRECKYFAELSNDLYCMHPKLIKGRDGRSIDDVVGTQSISFSKKCRLPDKHKEMTREDFALGTWMSAALEDSNVCNEMKTAINNWFNQFSDDDLLNDEHSE